MVEGIASVQKMIDYTALQPAEGGLVGWGKPTQKVNRIESFMSE